MIQAYPELFAAAMPVECPPELNPCSGVPVCVVTSTCGNCGNKMAEYEQTYKVDTRYRFRKGEDHSTTCQWAFTENRLLDWLFRHRK